MKTERIETRLEKQKTKTAKKSNRFETSDGQDQEFSNLGPRPADHFKNRKRP